MTTEQPLTESQQRAYDKIKAFLGNDNDSDIFVLKGYAGTGKTYLIKRILNYLEQEQRPCVVLAPTGRAAKVLRERVGSGATIHSQIYSRNLECLQDQEQDVSKKSFKFYFPIKNEPELFHIMIIDESSMVSNVKSQSEFFTFGSGILLDDILQYCKVCGINKLIFVGDPAQLPPVMDSHSRALDVDYLKGLNHKVESDELTDVLRQKQGAILNQATKLRELLKQPRESRHYLSVECDGDQVIDLPGTDLPNRYTDVYPMPEVGNGITVCFSNRRCYEVNQAIRSILFGEEKKVQVGDIVIISNNNYKTYAIPIFNGDMAKVTAVGEVEWRRGIPVTINKEKRHIDLAFRDVDLLLPEGKGTTVRCKVFDDLLHSPDARLSVWQLRAVYIDFVMRNSHLKYGSPDFKDALLNDLYFNALEVKFGYAITCHKSQGGEWDTVFVDYTGRCGLSDDHLRWCYTATTRAKNRLYAINAPQVSSMDRLSFTEIGKQTKAPKDFWQSDDTLATTYHPATDLIGVRLKHVGIEQALKSTDFRLVKVETCSWQDKFDFESSAGERVHIEVYYDGAGFFKLLPVKGDGSSHDMLCQLINTSMGEPRELHYEPGNELMRQLYQRVTTAAADTDVKIVNVVEMPQQYYVRYHLVTDARFAVITFYYSDKGLTTAMPMSELGAADEKLKKLIENIEDKH